MPSSSRYASRGVLWLEFLLWVAHGMRRSSGESFRGFRTCCASPRPRRCVYRYGGFLVNSGSVTATGFVKRMISHQTESCTAPRLLNVDILGRLVLNFAGQCLCLGVPTTLRCLRTTHQKKNSFENIPATRPPTSRISRNFVDSIRRRPAW